MDRSNSRYGHAAVTQPQAADVFPVATVFSAEDFKMMRRRGGTRFLPGWWIVPGIVVSLIIYGFLVYWIV